MTTPTFTEPGAATDDAPFGRKPDGTPYKRDPAQYATRTGRKRGEGAPAAPGKRSTPNKSNTAGKTQARAQAVFEALSIPVAGLAMAGQAAGSKPLIADAIVVGKASPQIAMAIAQVADQDDRVARLVDSLVQTGPYAALFTALLPVVVQLGANHSAKFAQAGAMLGAKSVDDIVAEATEQNDEVAE